MRAIINEDEKPAAEKLKKAKESEKVFTVLLLMLKLHRL
jgi:hypothetical protein